ncbi:hypothetical protein D3C76_1642610 [compost metagenome]
MQRELSAVDLAFQGQPVGQRRVFALGLTAALRGRDEQRLVIELAVELTEVIECDPWWRQALQGFDLGRFTEVAQQAVTQALGRDGAQLFLDRLDRS